MPEKRIAVIGAGIAGLTAADWLSAAGYEVTICEAKERAGGRIHTLRPQTVRAPIELGAEFIHGDDNETWKILNKRPQFKPVKFPDRHWEFREGQLKENKRFWHDLSEVMEKLGDVQRDTSFHRFLQAMQYKPERLRKMAKDYVEGFHAAAPKKASVIALEEAEESAEETNGRKVFRFENGYSSLVKWLVEKLRQRNVTFNFAQPVNRVRWKKDAVELFTTENRSSKYDAALFTLPLGVLQAKPGEIGAVTFEPELGATKKLIDQLRMGNVLKLTLVFRKPFSTKVFGFIHAHDEIFPTWWMDKGSNVLVGWSGGPKADDLGSRSREEILKGALSELSKIFGLPRSDIEESLIESFTHDWGRDPFARGAYAFLPVGTTEIPEQLAEPIEDTLFFAGEALAPSGQQGTVHGAMASGKAAARRILRCVS